VKQNSCPAVPIVRLLPLLLLGLAAGASGCNHKSEASAAPTPAAKPTVTTVHPERRTLRHTIEQPGTVEAFEQAPLYAKISGYVKAVNVNIGARVRKGDVLAELSVPEMEEELKQKEALVAQARIEIKQAEQALRVAAANLETARSLVREALANHKRARAEHERWESEYARVQKLVQKRVIDEQTRDETRNQFKAAEAALDLAEVKILSAEALQSESAARRDKAEADVEAARNRLEVAQAEQRRVAALLEYAQIRAPFDGVVSQRHVDPGHFLQPGSSGNGNKAEPLFVVVRTDQVRIFVEVPESDAVLVCDGSPARIQLQALDDREFEGKVAGCSWALEAGQRTLRAEIDFPNPDGVLRPGMYAYAGITVKRPGVLLVPAAAVLTRDGQNFCYCAENGRAVRTPIKLGARAGAMVEVLRKQTKAAGAGAKARWEKFSGEEAVITSNLNELADGQEITVSEKAE
jgi:RND family efflux transporter MFP subunit